MSEYERAIVTALIRDPSVINRVRSHLRPDDFPSPSARDVYKVILEAKDAGKDIDMAIISMANGHSVEELTKITESYVSSSNVGFYCQALQAQRVVTRIGETVGGLTAFADRPYPKLLEQVQKILSDMRPIPDSMAEAAVDVADEVLTEAMTPMEWDFTGKETGYPGLDLKIDGLHDGDFVVLGARTAIGKSALALNIATVLARKEQVRYYTYEMPVRMLMYRLYASLSSIDGLKIQRRTLTDAHREVLKETRKTIAGLRLSFAGDHPTISQLGSNIEQAAHEGVKTAVVDYLQIVRPDRGSKQSNYEHVTEVSGRLRDLSKRLGITILALSQLKRESTERALPGLTDLRESGAIEQDADVVLLLHRKREGDVLNPETKLVVAKNRYGDIGTVHLRFEGPFTRFIAT